MKNILIADDDIIILEMLESLLRRELQNINILKAISYKEALKHILNQDTMIHVAILDRDFPDSPDDAVIDTALKKHIPTIVLSGNYNDQSMIKKDIIDYIKKDGRHGISRSVKTAKRILNNYTTTVLIVDDSQTQLGILKEILLKLKLNVLTAHDGLEALDIIQTHPSKISLVLTDYNMDKMDGMELVFKLRDTYGKDELGIIVLSASDSLDIPIQFLRIGSNDYITKPYNEIEVITRVNSNLETLELFQKTKDLANKDFLTGLYNRRFFFEDGNKIFRKAQRKNEYVAVAMCDIDKFKSINDTYGHDVGDVAICEVARILNTSLRSTDLIARFGGEEFCILLENISLEETQHLLETIRKKFENNQLVVGDKSLNFTTSIGICYGLQSDLESMIKNADEALYFCKNNGRNQVKLNTCIA